MLDSSSTANSLCYEGAVLSAADLHFQPHGFSKLLFRRLYFPAWFLICRNGKNWIFILTDLFRILGSKEQIEIVKKFFKEFKTEETQIIVDPVMGDYGKPYPTYTEEMCGEMKKLVEFADILTPNVTEACVLTDTPYKEKWKIEEIQEMAEKIHKMGPKKIAITGIVQGGFIANFCYEEGQQPKVLRTHKEGTQRSGTGDIFASIIAADAVNGVPFYKSVKKASDFIKKCIIRSQELNIPLTDGVCFEEVLGKLKTD